MASSPAITAAPASVASVHRGDTWWDTVRSLLVVLAAVLGIRTFVAEATVIPTGSMESTILIGDHVFLNKLLYGPEIPYTSWRLPVLRQIHRGDIVAFHYPRNPSVMFVKRVIAQSGDVVKVIHKQVYVNDKPLDEPYAQLDPSNVMPLVVNFPPTVEEVQTIPAYGGLDPAWAREMPKYIKDNGCMSLRAVFLRWATIATTRWTAAFGASCRTRMWWASRCSCTGRTTRPHPTGRQTA